MVSVRYSRRRFMAGWQFPTFVQNKKFDLLYPFLFTFDTTLVYELLSNNTNRSTILDTVLSSTYHHSPESHDQD